MNGDGLDSQLRTASKLDVTEQRAVIKFCVVAGKTPFETKQLLDECGDRSKVSRSMMYKWYKRFKEGRCETGDDERSGRPLIIDSNLTGSVLQKLEKDRRLTVRDIADIFEISTSTAHEIITKALGFEKVCARWVPKLLSADEKNRRVLASEEFLRRWKNEGELFLNRIITTDETWLHLFDPETKQQSMMWKRKGSPPPKKQRLHARMANTCL
ncbi:protein GVQW3-like [Saccostrea echinata]|uniref:protein GVQW3-like n=1 Tax=Saccostrea echinata TaxID=191078 RepID=UPI002A7FCD3A|nr:protein GVQW3-like [Saccostrea echinata]